MGEFVLQSRAPLLACIFALSAILFVPNCPAQTDDEQRKSAVTPSSITLTPCAALMGNGAASENVRCGTFEVFEDRNSRRGRKIALKIVVYSATGQPKAPDPLFYIPGGPGSSSTEDSPYVVQQLAKLREHRDLVFVDQRGTGGSNPLNCPLFNPAELRSYLGEFFPLESVRTCRQQLEPKANLELYTTPIAMDDLDDVRAALGYKQINLMGTSYGTRAAQVYLKRHEKQVRSIVLHGVSPTNQFMPYDFPQHTERALNGVMADCAADVACRAAFPNLKAEAKTVLERLLRGPVEVELTRQKTGERVRVNLSRDLAAEAIRYMLYHPGAATRIPLFIHLAAQGNFVPLAQAAISYRQQIVESGSNGMYLSVTCAEDLPWIKPGEGERIGANTFLGDYRLRQQRAACLLWPRGKIPANYAEPTRSDVPALILTGQWDPVTPPAHGDMVAKALSHSLHVVVPHGAHGFNGLNGVDCIDNLIVSFVERGTITGLDTSCVKSIARKGFALELPSNR